MESAVPAIAGQLDPVHSAKRCKRRTTTVMNFQEGRIKNKKNNNKKKRKRRAVGQIGCWPDSMKFTALDTSQFCWRAFMFFRSVKCLQYFHFSCSWRWDEHRNFPYNLQHVEAVRVERCVYRAGLLCTFHAVFKSTRHLDGQENGFTGPSNSVILRWKKETSC